jgi:hypothetical protein
MQIWETKMIGESKMTSALMDTTRQACRLSLLAAVSATAVCHTASATPFIDVSAFWAATLEGDEVPTGIVITCDGNASNDCSNSLDVSHSVTHSLTETFSSSASLVITNAGDTSSSGELIFDVGWSAFNPGGPDIGLSIDNARQSASFSSESVGSSSGIGGDFHACSLPVPASQLGFDGSGYNFTTLSCGVLAPDSDEAEFFVDLASLAPGDSVELDNTLSISDSFNIPTPEPSGLAILGSAIFALAVSRRRPTG